MKSTYFHIDDWDTAYTNMAFIPGGEAYPARWQEQAGSFRNNLPEGVTAKLDQAYAIGERCKYDLFLPKAPKGLLIFVHGGYWMRFDRKDWSHLAAGPLSRGFAVAMPSYPLAPFATITGIVHQIQLAIGVAAKDVAGPIILVGHSAGGHLVSRAICEDTWLSPQVVERILRVVSISGVHDLRPLIRTQMNNTLRLSVSECQLQSPCLLTPVSNTKLVCWVGADERPEFIRQSRLLANVWLGLGARTLLVEEASRHHFDVVEGLSVTDSALMATILDA